MMSHPEIEHLISQVVWRHRWLLLKRLVFQVLPVVAGICVLGGLSWVLRGRAVPWLYPASVSVGAALVVMAVWWVKRMRVDDAVREADRHFGLKDAITSARHLAKVNPDGEMAALQWDWLKPRLAECRVETIRQDVPGRQRWAGAVMGLAAIAMCLWPASPAVRAAEIDAQQTRAQVEETKKDLEKLIEELEKEASSPEEKEALKLDDVRRMVKDMKETGDRTEAARQLARIEQKVRDATQNLDQRRDEETLQLAAKELAKAEETEARQLGKKLDAKELKDAAEMLERLAAKPLDEKAWQEKMSSAEKNQKMTEMKQELARMRAVSKRLAAAGKQRQTANKMKSGDAQNDGKNEALEDMMAEMDDAAAQMEKDLAKMEMDPNAKPCDGKNMKMANQKLAMMGKKMRGMQGKRMAMNHLNALRQQLVQSQMLCQGKSPGQGQMAAMAAESGGKQAGKGSSWTERKERDDSQKNGQLAQLQGQHGEGPSLSAVEDADSGSGKSNRKGGDGKAREFSRQIESFVQRDDVPESLKLGVRNYFEGLQEREEK